MQAELKNENKIGFILMKERPAIGYALFFMLGTYLSLNNVMNIILVKYAIVCLLLISVILLFMKKKTWYLILFVFLLFGYLRGNVVIPSWYFDDYVPPEETLVTATVEEIELGEKVQEYILTDVDIENGEVVGKIKLTDITLDNNLEIGDRINLYLTLERPSVEQKEGWYSEKRYLMTKGIQYNAVVFEPYIKILEKGLLGENNLTLRQGNIYERLSEDFDQPVLGVVYTLSTGDKSYMDSDIFDIFSAMGISHVFAISGLHIGILLLVWQFICVKRHYRLLIRLLGSLAIVSILIFIVGFRVSLLRASIMWLAVIAFNIVGWRNDLLNSLSLVALLLLIYNPLNIINLGFILSVVCVAGIGLIYIPFQNKFKDSKFANFYPISIFTVSIAVSLFSWAVLAKFFGKISVLAPLWNVIFIPLVTLILIGLLIYSITFWIPILGKLIAFIISILASITIRISEFASGFNVTLSFLINNVLVVVLILFGVALITDLIFKGRKKLRIILGVLICVVSISFVFLDKPEDVVEVFAGYEDAFLFINSNDETAVIINNDDLGINRIISSLGHSEIDYLIFSGNDIEELEELTQDNEIIFHNVIIVEELFSEYHGAQNVTGIELDKVINVGDVHITLNDFRANKKAVTHYYAKVQVDDLSLIYIDPLRLREGAIEGEHIIIASRWTKSRIECLAYANATSIVYNRTDFLMEVMPSLEDRDTITYNINEIGSVEFFIKDN